MFQAADEMIAEFLQTFNNLPLATMTKEEAIAEVTRLKAGVLAKNNSYISDVLARGMTDNH